MVKVLTKSACLLINLLSRTKQGDLCTSLKASRYAAELTFAPNRVRVKDTFTSSLYYFYPCRNSLDFIDFTIPIHRTSSQHLFLWRSHLNMELSLSPTESLPTVSNDVWPFRSRLNHLQTAVGCHRVNLQKWGHVTNDDLNYQHWQLQTMEHFLVCPNLDDLCTLDYLESLTPQARLCVPH